jgi:hypothetical protein
LALTFLASAAFRRDFPAMDETLTLTVSAKGQVTIKRSVPRHPGIAPGYTPTVTRVPGSAALRPTPRDKMSAFFAALPEPPEGRTGVSVEAINAPIARGCAGQG